MKRIAMIAIAALSLAALASCGSDDYEQFEVRIGGLKNSDGSKGYFGSDRIFYFDDGERIYMNNRTLTLYKDESLDGDGSDVWTATPNGRVTAIDGNYYCAYTPSSTGGMSGTWNSSSRAYRTVRFVENHKSNLILGTVTNSNVLTMWPSCAMLVFSASYRDDIQVYFKLTSGGIPVTGNFYPADRSVSATDSIVSYSNTTGAPNPEAGYLVQNGQLSGNRSYVLVPMRSNSISGRLIIRYKVTTTSSTGEETITYVYRESDPVTLVRGYRYTI